MRMRRKHFRGVAVDLSPIVRCMYYAPVIGLLLIVLSLHHRDFDDWAVPWDGDTTKFRVFALTSIFFAFFNTALVVTIFVQNIN